MTSEFHFRRTQWGMTKAQVMSSESARPELVSEDGLAYAGSIAGFSCGFFFRFTDDRLSQAYYMIDHESDAADVDAFFKLGELLDGKYGEGMTAHKWKRPQRRCDLHTYGEIAKAVATGDLELCRIWRTEDTEVALGLTEHKDEFSAYVIIKYWDLRTMEASGGADASDEDML